MTQTDSISTQPVSAKPVSAVSHKGKLPFNAARIIDALPADATPAQQDSAIQANLPERVRIRSTRPDTLEIPGIPAKNPNHYQNSPVITAKHSLTVIILCTRR